MSPSFEPPSEPLSTPAPSESVGYNPASNPEWRWDSHPDAQVEVTLLLKNLPQLSRQILRRLASVPCQTVHHAVLAQELSATIDDVSGAVARVNLFAESFGYVPLITFRDDGYEIDAVPTAEIVLLGLDGTERP
ncbi:hypothetical protein AB0O28_03120 [Microbispora sp. NPDC088329]|uniref:hypothetical protein n=1 Tax=Microbispora sp. NPDC088329 TaxID=3154869 RepID=UPI0034336973